MKRLTETSEFNQRIPGKNNHACRNFGFACAILFLSVSLQAISFAQASNPNNDEALFNTGHQLLAQLNYQLPHDAPIFIGFGISRAVDALNAVMARGQTTTATADDWMDLHRSLNALIELYQSRGDFLRAAIYANFQNFYYRNNEQDYEAALAASRKGLELQQRSQQNETLYLNWINIGQNLSSLGRFDEAVESFHQAQKLLDNSTSVQAANVGRDLVQAEIAAHHLEAAQVDVDVLLRQSQGASPLFQAKALLAQSDLFIGNEKYNDVLDSVRDALQIMTGQAKSEEFSYEATSQLMTCVLASMNSLSYEEAMALARRIDKEFRSLPFPVSVFAREAIRMRRRLSGDFDDLLREDVKRLEEARRQGNIQGQIEALQSLAVSYRAVNGNEQAILSLEKALSLEKSILPTQNVSTRPVNDSYYLRILGSLGDIYVASRQIGQARRCYDEIIHFIEAIPEMTIRSTLEEFYAQALLGKARVAELDDDSDTARDILHQALIADPKSPGKFNRADVLLQWARLEKSSGEQPAEAKQLYEEAIQAYRAQKNRNWEMLARLEYARFLAAPPGSRLPEAKDRVTEDLAVLQQEAQAAEFADAQWRVSFIQGLMAESGKQLPAAIEDYEKAVSKLDEIRAGLSQEEQRQTFMDEATMQELYQRLVALLTRTGQESKAWDYLERSKARAFLEMLRGRRFSVDSSQPEIAQLQEIERQMITLRLQLAPQNVAFVRGAGHDPEALHEQLHQLEARFTLARQQASLEQTRAGQSFSLLPADLKKTERKLSLDTALMEYSILPDSIIVFIVTRSGAQQISWKANLQELRQNVLQLRSLLADPNSGPDLKPLLESVSSTLLTPAIHHLPKHAGHLLIVPSDYLAYLPFQVLSMPDGRPLIEKYSISYLPSASTLQFLHPEKKLKNDLFLGALGDTTVDGMPPLPGTLKETAGIDRIYPKAQWISGKEFTHDRVEEALRQHMEVHLATHGLLDEQAPLFSAVLTSPAPNEPSRISLYEITRMKLRAQLVVLSACETGLGKLQRGDEVTGLTRTFLLAGADTVVSSLWKVSDDSTALLMEGFYRRLHAGKSPAEALRESALKVREKYPHPFYWAPFIVTGA